MHNRARLLHRLAIPAVLVGLPAFGEDTADPVDPVEDKALHEESQAKFDEALATFRQAFDACVKQAKAAKAGEPARDRNLARAEVVLEKIDSLSERISKRADSEKFLAGYDAETLGPVLDSAVRYERAQDLLAEGDRQAATKLLEPLGMIRHYWILGPFDNERGRGFNTAHEPEKKIELDGSYDGKERKVAWREIQVDQTLGYVDLDALLRPNDQCAAYAAAFVKSSADVDAAVRLGSDEAVRAWWNGKEVLKRDVRRRMGFDQDVVGVKVKAGWNVLLLKLHDQTGEWGFRARLTGADGSPLTTVTVAAARGDADEALKSKIESADVSGPVAGGAKQFYDAVAKKGGGDARDLFHLGYLHLRRNFDSASDRQAENLLQKASEADPTNAVFRFHYAEAASPPTEMIVEKEENKQRAGREKAIELDPKYAVAYRALASYYTTSVINLERAEQLLRRALEVNPEFWQARLDLAGVLDRRLLRAQAEIERSKALASANAAGVEEAARAAASRAERQGAGPDAATAWREVLKLDATGNDVRRRVAELAARALDQKGAVAVLDEIAAWDPYDTDSRSRKAEILEGAGDLRAAEATLLGALKIAPEDDELLQALGRVQSKAGRDKDALATMHEALRINPKNQALERYVEFLDPEAAPYEDDFHVDVAPLVEKAKSYDNKENDGWVVLLDQRVTKVNRDGTTSDYVHMAAKVLTDAGVKRFDKYRAPVWVGDAFKWKVTRVVKADGRVVDAKTSEGRGHVASFPPLEHGDVVDVEYRHDDREQSVFGDYFGEVNGFADQVPILSASWTLLTPAERTFYAHQRNMDVKAEESTRDEGRTRVWTWRREDVAKMRPEPGMPNGRETAPQVQVTSYKDWNEFAKWWGSLLKDQYIASDEMKAKVKELTAAKESRSDKIRAVFEFVTGDVEYRDWEFGVHGYMPYTATQVFESKSGDCKDKALLFNTMLREIGVDGYPVLLRSEMQREDEDLSLAMVNHFNHCIAYVPDTDGKGTPMFFDGTAQYSSASEILSTDQGAKVVVVKPEGAEIMTIPRTAPERMGISQKWDVKVRADGGVTAVGDLTWRGDFAIALRHDFSVEGQRQQKLQQMFTPVFGGKLKVTDVKFDDLKDVSRPEASFRVTIEAESFVKGSADAPTLPTTFLDPYGFSGLIKFTVVRPTRTQDLVLPSRFRGFRTEVDYELAASWSVVAPPENADITVPGAVCKSTASADGTKLHLVRDFQFTADRVTAADYPKFREATTKALAVIQQQWKLKKGDAPKAPETPPAAAPAGAGK